MKGNLWLDAAKLVPEKWQDHLSALTDLSIGPAVLLSSVLEEKEKCRQQQWSCRGINGRKVYVRNILQRLTFWLEKVRDVGDVIASFDPAHAALPWAGARFLILAVTSDMKTYGAMLEAVEVVVGTISRYRLIEKIYLTRDVTDTSLELETSIIGVYKEVLIFLCKARKYFSLNTAVRVLSSLVQLDKDLSDLTFSIATQDAAMEKWRPLLDAEMSERISAKLDSAKGDNKKMRDTLVFLECSMTAMSSTLQDVQVGMQYEERQKILKWLSVEQYPAHHKRIARQRLEGSGEWFFLKSQYKSWRNSSLCSLLWLHGRPGAGKSVLTSLVIDTISKELGEQQDPIPLAFFYCTRESSEPRRANPTEVLLSILKQFSCKNPGDPIVSCVANKYKERLDQGVEHRLDLDECVEIIIEITSITGGIIVIDALDECKEDTRGALLDALDKIIQESDRQVHIFVSSRPNWDIKHHFRRTPRLEIATGDISNDISDYVTSELVKRIKTGKFLGGNPQDDLVEQVREHLISNADGIFRWASASIQTLCDPRMQHPNDVRLALGKLPPDVDDVYGIILQQIHSGHLWTMPLAKKALRWLLHAQQALGSDDFIKALSTDLGGLDDQITVDLILDICCNLVMYDEELDVVRFVHLSVREFLETKAGDDYAVAPSNASIAIACLQSCINGTRPKRKVHLLNNQNRTFYDYATVYWPLHCAQASKYRLEGKLCKVFLEFLYAGKRASRSFREWLSTWEESWEEMDMEGRETRHPNHQLRERIRDGQSSECSPVFLACAFGFLEVLQHPRNFTEQDAKKINSSRRDPFTIAVRHGQEDIVSLLASMVSGERDATEVALMAAITMSRTPLVRYLLENNDSLEINKEMFEAAVSNSDLATIEFLLQHGKFETPEISKELLKRAAGNERSGREAIDLLLNMDEYVDIDGGVIRIACQNHSQGLAIVQRLFDHQEETTVPEDAAECAASNSTCGAALLSTLFQRSPELFVTDTMLEAAAGSSSTEPMRFLLAQSTKARPNYQCICTAAENLDCGDEMMELLLPRCNKSSLDTGLLFVALQNRKLAPVLVRLLLAATTNEPITITTEALALAASNKFGEQILEQILPLYNPQKITPRVAILGAANLYAPVEILKLLVAADSTLEFTTDVLEAGSRNPQYALELLLFFLSNREDLLSIPQVIEAVAANRTSGLEICQHFSDYAVTERAVEKAAVNNKSGDKILNLWYRRKLSMKVSQKALQMAVIFSHGPDTLRILLRIDPSVCIPDSIVERSVLNRVGAASILKLIVKHQGFPKDPEPLLWLCSRNSESSLDVFEILKAAMNEPTTIFGLEAGLSTLSLNDGFNKVFMHLLREDSCVFITQDALHYGLRYTDDSFTLLKMFLKVTPNLEITDEAMGYIVSKARSISSLTATIDYLFGTGRKLQFSESTLKNAMRGAIPPHKISEFIEQVCKERGIDITITTEVAHAILNSWDGRSYEILDRLIKLDTNPGQPFALSKELLRAALKDKNADKLFVFMKKHGKALDLSVATDTECKLLAAVSLHLSDSIALEIFGIDPDRRKALRNSEAGVMQMIDLEKDMLGLRLALLNSASPSAITSKVLIVAFKKKCIYEGHVALVQTLLRILTKQDVAVIANVIDGSVLMNAVKVRRFGTIKYLLRYLREHNVPAPITAAVIDLAAGYPIQIFLPIMQSFLLQNSAEDLRKLISRTTFQQIARSWAGGEKFKYLVGILGRDFMTSLFDEESLAGAHPTMIEIILEFITPLHPQEYYMNITELNTAISRVDLISVRRMMEAGTPPNLPNVEGRTSLHQAIIFGDICIANLLLKYPAVDINARTSRGRTALMLAAKRGFKSLSLHLLELGADKSVRDNKGKNAEVLATETGNFTLAGLIKEFGHEVAKVESNQKMIISDSETRVFLRSSKTF